MVPCLKVAAYYVDDTETGQSWLLCREHGDMTKEKGWVE